MDIQSWWRKRCDCRVPDLVTRMGGMAVALALVWSGHWQAGTGLAIFTLIVL